MVIIIESIELIYICAKYLYERYKDNPHGKIKGESIFKEIQESILKNQNVSIKRSLFAGALKYLQIYKSIRLKYNGAGFLFNPNELPYTVKFLPKIIDFVNRADYIEFFKKE